MKKNVLVVSLILVSIVSTVFAIKKHQEAENAKLIANEMRIQAEEMRDRSVELSYQAQRAASEAREAQMEAERAIQDCLNNK